MKVSVKLFVSEQKDFPVYETELEIPDEKLELLDEEETEAAVEMNVRTWAENHLILDWGVKS